MKIRLQNIGIIKDSTLNINGLTIITGKNNSGKTTVGKALYSIVDAVCDLERNAKEDRVYRVHEQLLRIKNVMEMFRPLRQVSQDSLIASHYPNLMMFLSKTRIELFYMQGDNIEDFAHALRDELCKLDVLTVCDEIKKYSETIDTVDKNQYEGLSAIPLLAHQKEVAVSILDQLFNELDKDPDLIAYARKRIELTLKNEFEEQIQPVCFQTLKSGINFWDDNNLCFKLDISGNSVVDTGRVYYNSPFENTFMVDDPFVLDNMQTLYDGYMAQLQMQKPTSVLNPATILKHSIKLKMVLRNASSIVNAFEQNLLDDRLKPIQEKINSILPGSFEFSADGDYYVQNGAKLKLYNLATGSKLFSIIKILLNSGQLTKDTMLILDEPEAHLHPQWQNDFAEVIVLLVKELGVHVLLTTHSPNFVLALDANMREYDIADNTSFYQTQIDGNGMVDYRCVDSNIEFIYDDFVEYLSAAKVRRDKYLGLGYEEE